MPRKMSIDPRVVKILLTGGTVVVPSKIVRPSVYNQNGMAAKERSVLRKVMVMLRFRLPPSKTAHMLLAPPPGLQPKINSPKRR